MEAVLPKSVDYLDVLPKAVPSERKRRKYYPANGTQYLAGGTVIIEVADSRHFLDVTNSYINLTLTNNSGQSLGLDYGGASVLIRNLRVQQAGNTIMNIQNYNRLVCAILEPCTNGHRMSAQKSITGQSNYGNTQQTIVPVQAGNILTIEGNGLVTGDQFAGSKYNNANNIADGTSQNLSAPLFGGLFSQSKLIPLPLLREPIQIIMDIEPNINRIGVYANDPVAGAGFTLSNVTYTAELIDVPRDVLSYIRTVQEMHGGSLLIQAQSFEHNNGIIPAGNTGEQIVNIPVRRKSIKSVLFVGQGDVTNTVNAFTDTAAAATAGGEFFVYNLSQSANFLLDNYQIKAGSLVFPPQPIRAPGGRGAQIGGSASVATLPDAQVNRGEAVSEVSKAFGHMGTAMGLGILNGLTYAAIRLTAPISNGAGGLLARSACAGSDFTQAVVGGPDAGNVRLRNVIQAAPMETTPFALDMEAFQNEAINSGIDTETLALDMNMVLNIDNALGDQAESINLDFYTWHDIVYYFNMDGSITYSQ